MSNFFQRKNFTNDVLIICNEETHYGVAGNIFHEVSEKRGFSASIMVADQSQELDTKKIEESRAIIFVSTQYAHLGHQFATLPLLVDRTQQLLLPFIVPRDGNRYEYEYIEDIIGKISEHFAWSIGLIPSAMEIIEHLEFNIAGPVGMVGMWGGPKIVMKPIALEVHNLCARKEFDFRCFLGSSGENLSEDGLVHLPQMLLSKIVGNNCMEFGNLKDKIGFQEGMSEVKHRLNGKKVLLILEGIDRSDVLEAIVDVSHVFGSGSRVLFTAPDKSVFESQEIKKVYEVEGLDETSAYQLLCVKAFNSMDMDIKYMDIIHRAKIYASGNPLTLNAIGSSFHGKSEVDCESVLDQFENTNADLIQYGIIENNQIQLHEDILEENMDYVMVDVQLPKVMEAGCDVI